MTPLARFVQRIARAGDAGGANVTVAATARLLSRMVAGLAVVQLELMGIIVITSYSIHYTKLYENTCTRKFKASST